MSYQMIDTILNNNASGTTASESHGMAVGMLCVNDQTHIDYWLNEVLDDVDLANSDDLALLEGLFKNARKILLEDEFSFALLLPDEDNSHEVQVNALRDWCQGFLYGIGSSVNKPNWPEDIRDVIKDITEFTKLEIGTEDEDTESDFMELTEYLRASVIFLRSALNSGHKGMAH